MPTLTSTGMHGSIAVSSRRLTRLVAIVAMCCALLLAGSVLATAANATAAHTSSSRLPAATYSAVEKTLVASLSLDSGLRYAWRKAFRTSCQQLNRHVPLLAAYRAVCLDSATSYDLAAAFGACSELSPTTMNQLTQPQLANRCQGRVDDKWAVVNIELVAALRSLNEILVRDRLSRLCQASFGGTRAAISYYAAMVPVLRLMAKSFLTDSPQEMSEAENRSQKLEAEYLLPSNHQQLSQFKRGCA